ncbi:MAG: YraN family protein, partial [Alphaproteobacteria bacterium]|nr:YraN family protein [Alphaproteobacteria bacterium]
MSRRRRAYLRGLGAERRSLAEALEAVTPRQQRRIERAAQTFLSQHPKWRNLGFRFDVMAVTPWRLPKH